MQAIIMDLIKRRAPAEEIQRAGELALRLGAGKAAFMAFDELARTEEVAWRMARFYDPLETDPVYRSSEVVQRPASAATYYVLWKNQSQRHREALEKLCLANQPLQASNPGFKANCTR